MQEGAADVSPDFIPQYAARKVTGAIDEFEASRNLRETVSPRNRKCLPGSKKRACEFSDY
ncbi:MAG: hypothetical protein FJ271_20795 [Planctomycetes bacterium]|nr:hypothetical protein [Planctomycetota bacterium]